MKFAPQAQLDDGFMDVVLTDNASRWDVLRELPRIRFGWHLRNPKVKLLRGRTITVTTSQPLPSLLVDVDGESAGFTPARLRVKTAAIRFIIPESAQ